MPNNMFNPNSFRKIGKLRGKQVAERFGDLLRKVREDIRDQELLTLANEVGANLSDPDDAMIVWELYQGA